MDNLKWEPLIDGESEIEVEPINKLADYVNELNKNKVDKVDGKGLSTNDFTNEDKEKVGKIDNLSGEVSKIADEVKNNIKTSEATAIINSTSGEAIQLTDSAETQLKGLNVYGKTTQNGTPTPDAPIELESVGDKGNIVIAINEQSLNVPTPNGLKSIPVTSGGNYTDSKGQQWVCDEVDFEKGVYIQRIGEYDITGQKNWRKTTTTNAQGNVRYDCDYVIKRCVGSNCLCSHYQYRGVNSATGEGIWVNTLANSTYNGGLRIMSSYTTLEEFKLFLQSQYSAGTPVKVLYILETLIETPLTEEEIAMYKALHTYYPLTNITNGEGAGMSVDYVADTKNYIDNKFAELQNAIISTGGNV